MTVGTKVVKRTGRFTGVLTATGIELAHARADEAMCFVRDRDLGPGHGETARGDRADDDALIGCLGEVAYAGHYDLAPPVVNTFTPADFPGLQLRSTDYHVTGHLIKFDTDPLGLTFVLILLNQPHYRIAGELGGHEIERVGFRPGDRVRPGSPPQLWVAQHHLRAHQPVEGTP